MTKNSSGTEVREAGYVQVPLHRLAHGRSGDKGNRQNISVIAYDPSVWPFLVDQVTEERVLELFRHRGVQKVIRYELPNIQALNFVIEDALEGGVNAALALDTHGKTSSFRLLSMMLDVPSEIAALNPEISKASCKGGTE
ncbi:MAG: AtuA-related protein [Pseudomonadota bacterium]|uniref:AtuA-related protein n=1 Tax=Fodinicurvata fenggangensis TaxID=1121830 RepID=UPI00047AC751|nr:hypothetical protein [Fodinicurvata fenggangensis]